ENKICRDFMRNACNRGNACRFRHPDNEETRLISDDSNPKEIIFCHDFQNNICKRNDCRFIHCTREDENTYKITGLLPKSLTSSLASEKKPPICLDFNKGFCKRGDRCKYRHI
ncbi:hypothetical protein HELRODRAFT_142412, partial [Helobdella robusta]|uniref:C3H1-type domain-containing protein n=1 Tax=Helobdella robusta TaxID=6412 RepID=T1EJ55_HELRO